jgi:type IX secretion system substrate protein
VDAAAMKDPTPATYTLIWLVALPADRLTATANLQGNVATVKWSTLSEMDTKYFIVERSIDNANWTATGNTVPAAGNSTEKREYQLPDNVADLVQYKTIYYRVKLVDIDGKITYSNVTVVRLSAKLQVSAWPNPFQSSISISFTTDNATTFNIRLLDLNGRLLRVINQPVAKGSSQVTLRDFDKLPQGVYLLEMTDQKSGATSVQRLIKN